MRLIRLKPFHKGGQIMKGKFLCLVCLTFFLSVSSIGFAQDNNSIGLNPLNVDLLAEESFLETEAGMTAYGQLNPVNVDLDLAENALMIEPFRIWDGTSGRGKLQLSN